MKLLLLDIETAPNVAHVWGLYDQNIAINQLQSPGYTLCWSAKWHHDREIQFSSVLDGQKRMVKRIHKLMCQADAICHYNGLKFDIPTLNKEFLLLGLNPPTPAKQIDLLQTARSRFRLASNKLDFVAKSLGLGQKLHHKGHELWTECMARNRTSFATMERYNKQDVVLLEKVYERLLPWIANHPNRSVLDDTFCCPTCGSKKYQHRGSDVRLTGKFKRYQCQDCGKWFRINLREKSQKTKAISI